MNVIGAIGNFIIKNQTTIELGIVVFIIALIILFAIKAGRNKKKKNEDILYKISDTVEKINTTVGNLNEKKTEVIYIDNRVKAADGLEDHPVSKKDMDEAVKEAMDAGKESGQRKGQEVSKDNVVQENMDHSEDNCDEADEADRPDGRNKKEYSRVKYFDRESGVDKIGNVHTEEELNQQIRE